MLERRSIYSVCTITLLADRHVFVNIKNDEITMELCFVNRTLCSAGQEGPARQ